MTSIAYSPCPNDTFIFHALIHGHIGVSGLDLREPVLADVETLNRMALKATFDVTKLSFHAYGHITNEYQLLNAGSALGRGCGPLLVSRDGNIDFARDEIAIPGELTTAAMLLKLFADRAIKVRVMSFEAIMDAVLQGEVAGGLIIHESRFTYEELGLKCVQDLGVWWEKYSGFPIPLGGIVARKSLGEEFIAKIDLAISKSVTYAHAHPTKSLEYIKENSQEIESQVVASHINLYVNDFTQDLGEEGRAAVDFFLKLGRERSLF